MYMFRQVESVRLSPGVTTLVDPGSGSSVAPGAPPVSATGGYGGFQSQQASSVQYGQQGYGGVAQSHPFASQQRGGSMNLGGGPPA